MKIGIIVFSDTGNTLSVAKKLQEKIGKNVELKQIQIAGNFKNNQKFKIKTAPKTDSYDVIIFCAQVMAFNLNPVMKKYLSEINSLENKKVLLLITQFFPFKWMGGNNSISVMKKICKKKGAKIIDAQIVNWSRKDREERINSAVDILSDAIRR